MLSDMKVFDSVVRSTAIETLAQYIAAFNAASAGAIVLSTEGFAGDFQHETMFKSLATAQRRVNRYGANGAVSATALSQIDQTGVKIAGGFGPIVYEPSQLSWIMENPEAAIDAAATALAEAMLADQLNTAIAAGVAAIGNVAAAVHDVSAAVSPASSRLDYRAINGAHAKFGDMSATIVADVMHSTAAHGLVDLNLANGQGLFTAGSVRVIDVLGRVTVVTDAPALIAGANVKVLGLTSGGLIVHDGGDVITNTDTANGKQRIEATFQADYTFGLAIKGYAWDTATGGKSPTDAALATGANWDQIVTSLKHTAGVLAIGTAA